MKKLVTVTEVDGEGLTALLGQNVILFCINYFYHGKLVGVNKDDVLLEEAIIVYDTGELCAKTFAAFQQLPNALYVRTAAIESYCVSGK